jgi:hypothetical protein
MSADQAENQVEQRELDRNGAIASAARDASARFQLVVSDAVAQRHGSYWVIDLHGSGRGLRYAINARDGSIRETSPIQ